MDDLGRAATVPTGGLCDFCTQPKPTWEFLAREFQFYDIHMEPEWMACNACHDLILAGQWENLIERGVAGFINKWKSEIPELLTRAGRERTEYNTRTLHAKFRELMLPIQPKAIDPDKEFP